MLEPRHHATEMLVAINELAERPGQDDVVIVDCRFDLLNPEAGRRAWESGHIPGAFYADLDRDLAGAVTAQSGRHPLPDPADFGALLGSWGVTPDTRVVAYDASGGAVAARLWWLLHWVGHTNVALLDGGFTEWAEEKLPLSQDQPALKAGSYPVRPGAMPVVSIDEVCSGLADDSVALVDARDAQRFAGQVEPIDLRAGHIPGALNRPFQINLDALGRFRASADLRESIGALPVSPEQRLVCMCGSGVTACHNIFAFRLSGAELGRDTTPALYPGSWSEWIRSGERPVDGIDVTSG